MSNTLEWAKRYVAAGFKVFPVAHGSKIPLKGSHGFKDATDNPAQLEAWWTGTNHGIGVATGAVSNCVVFDIDEPIGIDVLQSWGLANIQDIVVSSSNKKVEGKISYALWFKQPKGHVFKSGARFWEGIDIRAYGGFMVVPPSMHPSGSGYSWLCGDIENLPELPPRFLDELLLLKTKAPVQQAKASPDSYFPEVYDYISLDDAEKLIWNEATKSYTPWHNEAKKLLKKPPVSSSYSALFENGYIPKEGTRYDTLQSMTRSVSSRLFKLPGTHPNLLLALFARSKIIEQLQAQEMQAGGKDDFEAMCREMVQKFYDFDRSKQLAATIENAKAEARSKSLIEKIVDGVVKWTDEETKALIATSPEGWVGRNGLLSYRSSQYYIINEHGYYDKWPLTEKQILTEVVQRGFEKVFQTKVITDKGEKWISREEFINNTAYNIQSVTYAASKPEDSLGATVDFKARAITIPAFWRREDVKAEFDKTCDIFLRTMFGKKYDEVEKWFSHALAIEESKPICGLLITGPKGIGKSLLGKALIHCFTNGAKIGNSVDGKEGFISDFNAGLKDSPVVYIDEGLEVAKMGDRDISIPFRQMVGSEYHSINQKNRDLVQVKSNVRVLVTANEESTLDMLVGRCLGAHSFDAVSQRIKHINITEKDAEGIKKFLEAGGQWTLTNEWVTGEGKLVKHLFWIFKERRASHPEAGRFLVDGGLDANTLQYLKMKDGINGALLRALTDELVKKPLPGIAGNTFSMVVTGQQDSGLAIQEGEIYLMRETVLRWLVKIPDIDQRIDPALEVLTVKPPNPITVNKMKKRWRKLRMDMYLEYLEDSQHGEKIKKLLGVEEKQEKKAE